MMNNRILFLILMGCLVSTTVWGQNLPPEKEQKLLELESRVAALEKKAAELKLKIDVISKKIFKKNFSTRKPKIAIRHTNEMAGYLRIMSIKYYIIESGRRRTLKTRTATIKNKMPDKFQVYSGNLPTGQHTIGVEAKVRGYNPILTYINNYKVELSNQHKFQALQGRSININVLFKDTGGRNLGKRLSIVFSVKQ